MVPERARAQRATIAIVQVLCLATWFSASAVVPSLQREWNIDLASAVWLTGSTQIGFVVGAIASAATNLADRVPPQRLILAASVGAFLATSVIAIASHEMVSAIPLRFITGVFLAGVYPVGMKLMASWAPSRNRGLAFGLLIGALTIGSSLPHLIGALPLDWRTVLLVAATVTLCGGIVSAVVLRPGPHIGPRPAQLEPTYFIRMFRDRNQRLINIAYFGHMWELYALWAWFPLFAAAATGSAGFDIDIVVFVVMGVAGLGGCLFGGWAADRWGRGRTAAVALAVSGACCLLSPLSFDSSSSVLVVFSAVWGASVIADSGVFSTMLSEQADPRFTGTALTAQTAVGFLVTVVTIQIVPVVATALGWHLAFLVLLPGPVFGVVALARLSRSVVNKPTEAL